MKAKVPLYRTNPTRAVLIDTEATQGAVVGVNLFNQDGSLYVSPSAGAAAPGTGIALDDVQVLGPQSVTVTGSMAEGAVTLALVGDAAAPGNTYLYSTGLTGTKGWNALSGMLHQSANVAVTFGVDGTATFDLQPLTDSGAGTFKLITRDSYGRLAGTKAGTTSDVPEGTNLYYTDVRADARIALQKGQPNGLATLGADSKLDPGQLPALAITETFVVSTQAAMLALAAQQGDVCVRTDLHDSFILTTNDPTILANWQQLETPVDGVASFNGRTGSVTPASGDYNTTQVTEGSNLYFTAARVLATVLAGLSTATNAVITATDTVLSALGKLQAQISANVTALAGKLTAANNLSDVANAATALSNIAGMPIAGGTFTGTVQIQPPGAGSNLNLFASASGQQNRITGLVAGNRRWLLQYGDGTTESGGNSGSDYTLYAAADDGTLIADYMRITRSNGNCSLAGTLAPFVDNSKSCGAAAQRWSVIYAATGAINTSDAREKTEVAPLTSDEIAAAADMARAIGTYQWLASTADKGADKARHHVGLTVQRAIEIMQAHGLDPFRYGFICYDQWDATPEQWTDVSEIRDEKGNVMQKSERVLTRAARAAGDRYSFRMDELSLFLARGFAERLDALEAKVA